MKTWREGFAVTVCTLVFVGAVLVQARASSPSGPPRLWAQSDTFSLSPSALASGGSSSTMFERVTQVVELLVGTALGLIVCYFGLFPYLLRRRRWPIDAFGVASWLASFIFFALLFVLYFDDLVLTRSLGRGGIVDHLPKFLLVAVGLVCCTALRNFRRGEAKQLRSA